MKYDDAQRVMGRSSGVGGGWRGRVLLGVGLAITLCGVACRDVAEVPADSRLAGLSDYIRSAMADWDLPGLAVAVVHADEVIFAEGFGVKELGREDPVDAHTLFQIGSISKSFGAATIGALVDDGLVQWGRSGGQAPAVVPGEGPRNHARDDDPRPSVPPVGDAGRRLSRADDHGRPGGGGTCSTPGQPSPAEGEFSLQQPGLRGGGAGG